MILTAVLAAGVHYHAIRIAEFSRRRFTHVCTTGAVTYKKHEDDRDWHYRLEDGSKDPAGQAYFVVAEVTEATPLPQPFSARKGDRVEVCGRRRFDDAPGHGWWEVNPVERARVLTPRPERRGNAAGTPRERRGNGRATSGPAG